MTKPTSHPADLPTDTGSTLGAAPEASPIQAGGPRLVAPLSSPKAALMKRHSSTRRRRAPAAPALPPVTASEDALDEALEETFPASDPISPSVSAPGAVPARDRGDEVDGQVQSAESHGPGHAGVAKSSAAVPHRGRKPQP